MSDQEPTIKDVLIAMASMEGRLRTDLGGDIAASESRLRAEIHESTAASAEAVQSLATHMDGRFTRLENTMASKDFVDRRIAQSS